MKILLLYEGFDEYTVQLWENIKKKDPQSRISLLTTKDAEEQYRNRIQLELGEVIYTESDQSSYFPLETFSVVRNLPQYDIIHITYMELKWGVVAHILRRKCSKLIVSVGGSDMYRTAQKLHKRMIQLRVLNRADMISSENSQTKSYFYKVYGDSLKRTPHHIIRYGVNVIDAIKESKENRSNIRTRWSIPEDKAIIMLGHNGSEKHQHLGLIEAISRMDRQTVEKCFFIVPMTYLVLNREYRSLVEEKLSVLTGNYMFLDDYLSVEQMAEITIATDVMIHVQTTDQLSSTMMAHIYNENIVIAGSWLPYDDISDAGMRLFRVDIIDGVTKLLSEIVDAMDDYKKLCDGNREKAYRFSSWECCADKWIELYKGE